MSYWSTQLILLFSAEREPWHHRSASFRMTKFWILNLQFSRNDEEGRHLVFSTSTL